MSAGSEHGDVSIPRSVLRSALVSAQRGWTIGIALLALGSVGAAVYIAGSSMKSAQWREENRRAVLAAENANAAEAAPGDTGVARGGSVPHGQPPATALTVPRFIDAFNADASQHRLVVLLSPT